MGLCINFLYQEFIKPISFPRFLFIKVPLSTDKQDALFFLLPYDPLVFPVVAAIDCCIRIVLEF